MNTPPETKVCLLGLGIMGSGMAGRLLAAGYPLTVYNRSADKAASLVEQGAKLAGSPREAAEGATVIISMLADDSAARALWLGDQGALAAASTGTILIESSTVTVQWINELATAAKGRGGELLDAPVTGSRTQAANGELTFLVGGAEETLDKVRAVLAAMSKNVMYVGPLGSGALLKLINNFVCGVQIGALAEAMAMIERSGLDRTKALELLTGGAPGSPLVKALAGRMTSDDYTPHFMLKLMAKDLTYAKKAAEKESIDLTTATAALALFQKGIDAGLGEKDIAAVVEPLRKK